MKSLATVNIYHVIKGNNSLQYRLDVFPCGWNRNVFRDVMLTFIDPHVIGLKIFVL